MDVNVLKDTPHLPRRQPASVRDWRTRRRAVAAQQMHGQHGGQPLQIKASAWTTFAQLAPSERAEASDHWILDADRGPDREIICLIEGLLRDLRNEDFIECEREEGRRGTIADPEWKARVTDMSLAMRVFRRANLTPEPGDRRPKLTP